MKRALTLLNLLLCLELILGPMAPSLSIFNNKVQADTTCPAGLEFNSTLNRCLTSAQTANVMNATASCGATDYECYKNNAKSALAKKEEDGEIAKRKKNMGWVSTVGNAAAVALPLYMAISGLKDAKESGNSCASISYYALVGGGVSLLVGEILSNMQHKSRIKKIEKDWGNIISEGAGDETNADNIKANATEAQGEAFEMLARSEDSMSKAAKTKSTFYTISMGAFAVSAGLAIYELTPWGAGSSFCGNSKKEASTDQPAAAPSEDLSQVDQEKLDQFSQQTQERAEEVLDNQLTSQMESQTEAINEKMMNETNRKLEEQMQNLSQPTIPSPPTRVPPQGSVQDLRFFRTISHIYSNEREKELSSALQAIAPRIQAQKIHNLSQAKSISELYMIQKENNQDIATVEEFNKLQQYTADIEADENPEVLRFIKMVAIQTLQNIVPIQSAHAEGDAPGFFAQTGKNMSGHASKIATEGVTSFLQTPTGRLAVSTVLFGWATIMNSHAKSQAKASKNRAKTLREMKEDFKSASGAINQCSANDRNDTSKPACYCYTSDGQRNPNRGNSQICVKLFTGKNYASGNYYGDTADSFKGCINNSGSYDETCACRAKSNCLKAVQGSIKGINPGTFSMMASTISPLSKLANGALDTASVDSANLENNAMRMMAHNEKLAQKLAPAAAKKNEKYAKAFEAGLVKAAAGGTSPLFNSSASSFPTNPKEAASMLEKEVKDAQTINSIGGSESLSTPSNSANDPGFEFGLTADQAANQDGQIAELMKQDLDYGGNDINQGSNTNIFELLTNRYQRSGMRRLFDEKGVTKPEPAAKSDINK